MRSKVKVLGNKKWETKLVLIFSNDDFQNSNAPSPARARESWSMQSESSYEKKTNHASKPVTKNKKSGYGM